MVRYERSEEKENSFLRLNERNACCVRHVQLNL